MSLYHANVTLHLLAALLWLGGLFFLALVGAPVLRRVEPPALRAELFKRLGERFRLVGWIALAVLLATGTANLHFRGLLSTEVLGSAAFWATPYGRALAWKLGAVGGMLVIQALHDFRWGPAAGRAVPDSPEALRLRGRAAWLARMSALLGLVIAIAAARLARGG
ncbi:MAG: CopD family protein [Gemmatimonadetes bacterium]|nr:CopD family protein [Gemmatimonadota bacterium]